MVAVQESLELRGEVRCQLSSKLIQKGGLAFGWRFLCEPSFATVGPPQVFPVFVKADEFNNVSNFLKAIDRFKQMRGVLQEVGRVGGAKVQCGACTLELVGNVIDALDSAM